MLVASESLYLSHILSYVRAGRFAGLSNAFLRRLGEEIDFYPGLPGFFEQVRKEFASIPRYAEHDISVEHYVISSGLRQMILGSSIAAYVDDVWACEFSEETAPPGYLDDPRLAITEEPEIAQVLYTIDNTTKTRAVFEINKGTNKEPSIDVNAKVRPEDRRVPFHNMIYVADGPSDIPVFSIVRRYGGKTYAVYESGNEAQFAQANRLQEQGRVHAIGPASYEDRSHSYMWLTQQVDQIAKRIVAERTQAIADRLGPPPRHLDE